MPYRKQHSNAPPAAQLPCKKAKQAHNCIHVRSFLTISYCFTHHIRQLLRLLNRQPWLFHPARHSFPSARRSFPSARRSFPSARRSFPSARCSFPSARPRRIHRDSAYFLPDGGHKKSPGADPRAYRICNTVCENRGPAPGKVSPGEAWRDRPLLKRRVSPRSSISRDL